MKFALILVLFFFIDLVAKDKEEPVLWRLKRVTKITDGSIDYINEYDLNGNIVSRYDYSLNIHDTLHSMYEYDDQGKLISIHTKYLHYLDSAIYKYDLDSSKLKIFSYSHWEGHDEN